MARRNYDRYYGHRDQKEEIKEEISLPQKEVEKKATMQAGKVIGGLNLNVRKKPEAYGEIIGTVRDGAAVQIIETVNEEWYHIASPNGYVMKKYVQV